LGVHRDSNSQSGSSLGNVRVHSLTLSYTPGNMRCDSRASLLARTLANPCFGCEPKAWVTTYLLRSMVFFITPYYVVVMFIDTFFFLFYWCLLMPSWCVLLVFVSTFLLCFVDICQHPLIVLYWCLLMPLCYALILVVVGASLLILVFKYLFNPRCLLVSPCYVLLFVNVFLLCYVDAFWDSKLIFPPHIFFCKCGISNFIDYTHFLIIFNNKYFFLDFLFLKCFFFSFFSFLLL